MLSDLLFRLRALFSRGRVEAELEDELSFHIERQTAKLMSADPSLSRKEAARRARIQFGGVAQAGEDCRDAWGITLVSDLSRDARFALRRLRKSPSFTFAVILSLALGIGVNTAIFTLVDAVLWRMLPVRDPQSLWAMVHRQGTQVNEGFTYHQFRALSEPNAVLAGAAAYGRARFNVSISEDRIEPAAEGQLVSGDYFELLGVRPQIGRAIGPGDDRSVNAHPVAMLSDRYWKRRFSGDRDITGRTIRISGLPFTIIGVTPPEFFGVETGVSPDIYVALMMQPTVMPAVENLLDQPILYSDWLNAVVRFQPGVTDKSAAAALGGIYRRELPQGGGKAARLQSEQLFFIPAGNGLSSLRNQFSDSLLLLLATAGAVLLIACANIANLLLARGAARRHEIQLRQALGAGRRRLLAQLLIESLVLAAAGGVLAIACAHWAAAWLVTFLSEGRLTPVTLSLEPSGRILAFTAAIAILTGILCGLVPAFLATGSNLARPGRPALSPGKALAVLQVALSLVLLFAAGLFVRSLERITSRASSPVHERVLVVRVEPKGSDQRNIPGTVARLDRIYRDLLESVRRIPGVQAAGMAQFTPMSVRGIGGNVEAPAGDTVDVFTPMVYPGFFGAAGLELIAGRDFREGEPGQTGPVPTVINEAFARRVFPGIANPTGREYRIYDEPNTVIGVVRDSLLSHLRSERPVPIAYRPFLRTPTGRGQMALYVRSASPDVEALIAPVRSAVQAVDPAMPLFDIRSVASELDGELVRERLLALLSGLFGALAVAVACIGLYGLFTFHVVRRTREMAIRKAIGASWGQTVAPVMREVLSVIALGVLAGVPAALACGRMAASRLSGLLFGLGPGDVTTIAGATALLACVAALAGFLPARRAASVDPAAVLRIE